MKKLMFLGLITIICCLNLCAKNNEVIKINNHSRKVIADKVEESFEKMLNFSQSNIISSEVLKELNKSSTNKDKDTLVPSK